MSGRDLTLIFPYYLNPGMLQKQYAHIRALPDDVKAQLRLIVVDDGSPADPATKPAEALGIAGFALYRIMVDVRWNWIACRNLAVARANTTWVLLTDIDHMLPEKTARRIIFGELNSRDVYRFRRVDAPDMTPYKEHPNTWLMTRGMFDQIGGYDERFSGYYGTDGEFRDRVTEACRRVEMLEVPMIRVPREVEADASTTAYQRKQPEDGEAVPRIRAERNAQRGWKPLRGTFPWERVA